MDRVSKKYFVKLHDFSQVIISRSQYVSEKEFRGEEGRALRRCESGEVCMWAVCMNKQPQTDPAEKRSCGDDPQLPE